MKKQMRKLTMVLSLLVALAMTVLSYGEHVEAASKVKLNKTKVTLAVGESTTLKMNGTSKKVTWSTSNKKVATVSKGKVTAKKKGTANITAKIGNKKYTCKVTVEAPKLSKTSVTLNQGKSTTLKLSGTSRKVTWTTSKKSVAKVSNGKVTAVGAGTANITAKVGSKTYTCKVTVEAPKPTGISFEDFRGRLASMGWTYGTTNTYNFIDTSINRILGSVRADSTGVYFLLKLNSPQFDGVIKQCFNLLLPTQGDKLYNTVSKAFKDQTLKMDGRTVTISQGGAGVSVTIVN